MYLAVCVEACVVFLCVYVCPFVYVSIQNLDIKLIHIKEILLHINFACCVCIFLKAADYILLMTGCKSDIIIVIPVYC